MSSVTLPAKMRVPSFWFPCSPKSVLEVVYSGVVEDCRENVGGCCGSWLSLHS